MLLFLTLYAREINVDESKKTWHNEHIIYDDTVGIAPEFMKQLLTAKDANTMSKIIENYLKNEDASVDFVYRSGADFKNYTPIGIAISLKLPTGLIHRLIERKIKEITQKRIMFQFKESEAPKEFEADAICADELRKGSGKELIDLVKTVWEKMQEEKETKMRKAFEDLGKHPTPELIEMTEGE